MFPVFSDQMSPASSEITYYVITNALPYITLLQQPTQISCNMYAVSGPGLVTHCGARSHSRGGELLQLLSVSSELLPKFSFCQAQAQLFGFSSAVLSVIVFFFCSF